MRKLVLILLTATAFGQQWSGILNGGRAVPWESNAGIPGGIPNYVTACTTAQAGTTVPIPATVTNPTIIANALAACSTANPGGSFLSLASGSFALTGTLIYPAGATNVTLRGAGPKLTTLTSFSGSTNCGIGQNCGVSLGPIGVGENSAVTQPGGSQSLDLTGTTEGGAGVYPQGATHITVTNVGSSKPQVGYLLIMDQLNDTSAGGTLPVASGIVQGEDNTVVSGTSYSGNGSAFGRCPNSCTVALRRSQAQVTRIVACTPNCTSPTGYTISPGLLFNNVRQSKSPGAWWSTTNTVRVGLENLTVNDSNNVGEGIMFSNSYQAWTKNVMVFCTGACVLRSHYAMVASLQGMVKDGYIFGSRSGGESYGVEPAGEETGFVIENTIFHQIVAAFINASPTGFVYDYNYGVNWNPSSTAFLQCGYFSHDNGAAMNLYEGNSFPCIINDNQHGNSPLSVVFRNYVPGNEPVPYNKVETGGAQTNSFNIDSYSRANSLVGNVLGISLCHGGANDGLPVNQASQCPGGTISGSYEVQYECSSVAGCTQPGKSHNIYVLGWGDGLQANNSGGGNPGPTAAAAGNDPEVRTSLMRWGNCDSVTNTCRFQSSEVPTTGGTFYSATSVPANNNLPPSFFYLSTPSWWTGSFGTPPFPPYGPDVTGGNLVTVPAGHAYKNLAQLCFENTPVHSGQQYIDFDGNNCYVTGAGTPAVTLAPTSLSFGTQIAGTTSSGLNVTLTNSGTATLNITNINLSGSYPTLFAKSTTCGLTLGAGLSCTVTVTFSPLYFAPVSATLVFTTNASSSPDTVNITGIGTANGMVLYPGGATHPSFQLNIFSGPINVNSTSYSHLIGSGSILNSFTPGQYITGMTHTVNLGCTAANCTGANGTYIDHGASCPSLVFSTGTNPLDTIVNNVASLGYKNNFILFNTSYGAGPQGNSSTAGYEWLQAWANSINNDCLNKDTSLTRANLNSAFVIPGDYIFVSSTNTYLQMQKKTCTNAGDTNDVRCQLAASAPACITTTITIGATCADGSGTNAALWTSIGTNAPPLDSYCDGTYPGATATPCFSIPVSGTATITGGNTIKWTVTSPGTWHTDSSDLVTITNASNSQYNCSGCAVTAEDATSVTATKAGLTNGSASVTGTLTGAHFLNVNSTNASQAILQTTMPIPWEQPNRQRMAYIYKQFDAHYKNSIGYIRLGLTKGGEASQDGIGNWPCVGTPCGTTLGQKMYLSYEKTMYQVQSQNGGGTDFACVGNLNTNPSAEAAYMTANNCGPDNNAQGTNHAYTLQCYSSPTAAAACGATYSGGLPPAGKLFHGGDWALEFSAMNSVQGNGKFPSNTLQTTQDSTPGSTPGNCSIGTCANGSCTSPGVTGAMSQNSACTNATFPAPNGFPGNLPLGKQYLENNEEMYFCDAALGLDSAYTSLPASVCPTLYDQVTYAPLYKAAFQTFLAGATIPPSFTSASAVTFTVNALGSFTVSATGTPTPTLTITSGTLPSGVTFVDNGNGTGTLGGTPTATGVTSLTFTATNSAGVANQGFTLTVVGGNTQGTSLGPGSFTLSFMGFGPPFYAGSCASLAAQGPTSIPFSGMTGAGVVVNDPEPVASGNNSGCFHNPIVRVTDRTLASNATFHVPGGGSSDENEFNTNSTLFMVQVSGTGLPYAYSFNPSTMQTTLKYSGAGLHIPKSGNFSYTQSSLYYSLANAAGNNYGTLLQSSDLSSASIPTPVTLFDLASSSACMQAQGSSPNWADPLDVSKDDQTFVTALSYTGGQDTGIYVAVWNRTKGCIVLNTSTGAVTSDAGWGVSGTLCGTGPPCPSETFNIHNVKMRKDGNLVYVEASTCLTTCTYGQSPYGWSLASPLTLTPQAPTGTKGSGHWTSGYSTFINGSGSPVGQFERRTVPNTPIDIISSFPVGLVAEDQHSGWSNVDLADTLPFLLTRTPDNADPTYTSGWDSEVLGLFPTTGIMKRFAHCYNRANPDFWAYECIGSVSQDGRFYMYVSPMNNQLGSTTGLTSCTAGAAGNCAADVFIVKLQ